MAQIRIEISDIDKKGMSGKSTIQNKIKNYLKSEGYKIEDEGYFFSNFDDGEEGDYIIVENYL